MTNKHLSIFNQLRPITVGFDNVFDHFERRYFSKAFTVADDVEVKGAELKDGLLKISMERIIPEGKKPRAIEIK